MRGIVCCFDKGSVGMKSMDLKHKRKVAGKGQRFGNYCHKVTPTHDLRIVKMERYEHLKTEFL